MLPLFMQSAGSRPVDGGILGKHFGPLSLDGSSRLREPDLETSNPDSQSQTLESERRRVTTGLNGGEGLSVHQAHLASA